MYRSILEFNQVNKRLRSLLLLIGLVGLLPTVAQAQTFYSGHAGAGHQPPAVVHYGNPAGHRIFSHRFPAAGHSSGTVHRGPLGFETHYRIRHYSANERSNIAGASGYYQPGCRTVYKDTYVNGYPATVSGQLCYDEYGEAYVDPHSRQLVEYH